MFLEVLQNLQENICVRVSFLQILLNGKTIGKKSYMYDVHIEGSEVIQIVTCLRSLLFVHSRSLVHFLWVVGGRRGG